MSDLFREPYGGLPPFVRGNDTSEAAAMSKRSSAPTDRAEILAIFEGEDVGEPEGFTCDEIEAITGLRHQTASARIRELVLMDRLCVTEQRRPTRSGRTARVYSVASSHEEAPRE